MLKKIDYLEGATAVIFDLGGVIVNLDIDRTRNELARLLKMEPPALYYKGNHLPIFTKFEVGLISSSEFIDKLLELAIEGTTRDAIINAWNAMLINIPAKRVEMLEKLGKNYRLFILSNTNQIHVDRFEKMAPGYRMLSDLFEKPYYSHLIGSRKPTAEAFQAVLSDSGLEPSRTLFVDDLEENIETALKLGFKTLLIHPGQEVTEILTGRES